MHAIARIKELDHIGSELFLIRVQHCRTLNPEDLSVIQAMQLLGLGLDSRQSKQEELGTDHKHAIFRADCAWTHCRIKHDQEKVHHVHQLTRIQIQPRPGTFHPPVSVVSP